MANKNHFHVRANVDISTNREMINFISSSLFFSCEIKIARKLATFLKDRILKDRSAFFSYS